MPITVDTAHGYQVTATRVGIEFQVETSNAQGAVVSNIRMSEDEFYGLWCEMQDVAGFKDKSAFKAGYSDGYDNGYADAE